MRIAGDAGQVRWGYLNVNQSNPLYRWNSCNLPAGLFSHFLCFSGRGSISLLGHALLLGFAGLFAFCWWSWWFERNSEIEEDGYWKLESILSNAPPDILVNIETALRKGKITKSEYDLILNKYSKFKEATNAKLRLSGLESAKNDLRVKLTQATGGGVRDDVGVG